MSIESIRRRKGTDVTTIAPEASIKRAVDWLRAKNIGALVVTSGNAVLGLISERGNRSCILSLWRHSRVDACEGNHAVRCDHCVPGRESVNRVMNLMTHHRVRHILVLRGGELAGIV